MPPRSRKRQRNQKQTVKHKQDVTSCFMSLPIEIFDIIISYLSPLDLLHLARLNKSSRSLLMSKSTRDIWASAMNKIDGLPCCPSALSEPQYVALLFTNNCSICGTTSRTEMQEDLLVRICDACRDEKLMPIYTLPSNLHGLVPHTRFFDLFVSPSIRIPFRKSFAFRDEVNDVRDKYNELSESPNHEHLEVWANQVELQVTQRQTFAAELRKFLSLIEDKRVEERRQRLASRRNEIKERLLALGWEEDDIESSPYIHERAKEWDKLVETPEDPSPLTDRIWKNLYAKLRPLLKPSRQERLEYQSLQMQARRRECLDKFLKMIKNQERPLLKVKLRQPDSQALRRFNRPRVQHDVFPFVQDALDWPFIQALNERNLTIEEFRRELEQHRNKIEIHISKWQNKTRRFLVDLVWKEDTEPSDLLDPPKNMDRDAYAGLSDNQKVLLRADSLFYPEKAAGLTTIRPYSYDEALRIISPSYRLYPNDPWDMKYYSEPESPELDSIHQHARAQEVARHLLKDLGKSNASFLEINQFFYTCQRCHDKEPMYWTEIIEHYLQQKHSFTRIKKQASALAQQGIIYRNVHAPGNKPMIRPCKPKKPVQANVWRCNLCAKKPMSLYVIAPKPNLYRHLLEVHAVPKHRLDLHYRISSSRLFWTDCDIRYIYWQEEGDELDKDNEEIEADNGPEQEREDKDVKSMDGEESSEGDDMAS